MGNAGARDKSLIFLLLQISHYMPDWTPDLHLAPWGISVLKKHKVLCKTAKLHIQPQFLSCKTLPPWRQFEVMLKNNCTNHNDTCFRKRLSKIWDQLLSKSLWLQSKFKCFLFSGPSFLKDQCVQASSMSSGGTLSPGQQEGSYFELWALCHSSRSHSLIGENGSGHGSGKISM